ncbi:hypothetical protein ACQR0Z_26795 [Bradyrhizobium sp. HKCCYLS3077]|uniref:hypothetical protein n=1 Tax=Bradyrhizobium sp. HKCCYLS3077 TaxID=3420761 RepID=UPI003EBB9811
MKLSSSVTPSAVALLATILLCGAAAAQPVAGPAPTLPGVTVDAPKAAAKPARPTEAAETAAPRRAASTRHSTNRVVSGGQTPSTTSNEVLDRITKLERAASSCNGGCETSFKSGNQPWIGCSLSGQESVPFDGKCSDTLTYAHYSDCQQTKAFLGWDRNKIWWHCSSLQVGNKFKVAEIKRSKSAR